MSDDEKKQIEKLKEVALNTPYTSVMFRVIDTLAVYGSKAITSIAEIADKSNYTSVKSYALETVKIIKEK